MGKWIILSELANTKYPRLTLKTKMWILLKNTQAIRAIFDNRIFFYIFFKKHFLFTMACNPNRPFGKLLCKWGDFEWAKTTFKIMLASWFLVCFFKRFRSFNAEKLESVDQRALKLLAIKLWEWFDPGCNRIWAKALAHSLAVKAKECASSKFDGQ